MKKYVLDTGFFVAIREYYPRTFPSFWQKMDSMVAAQRASSVHEVFEEIQGYGGEQAHLLAWAKDNKIIFTQPTPEEQRGVIKIFETEPFQRLVSKKQLLQGGPVADPFVIAKAIVTKSTVVTREQLAPQGGPPRIPDVCEAFAVPCMTPQQFMEEQGWTF